MKSIIKIIVTFLILIIIVIISISSYSGVLIDGNGEILIKSAINQITNGAKNISFKTNDTNINYVVERIKNEPELLLHQSDMSVKTLGELVTISIDRKYDTNKILSTVKQKAQSILMKTINPNISDEELVKLIYTWISINIKLSDNLNPNENDIYGALIYEKATSEGISKAFTYLLKQVDIKSEVISGTVNYNNCEKKHYWNIIYINNNMYYCDIALENNINTPLEWFGASLEKYKSNHSLFEGYKWENVNTFN